VKWVTYKILLKLDPKCYPLAADAAHDLTAFWSLVKQRCRESDLLSRCGAVGRKMRKMLQEYDGKVTASEEDVCFMMIPNFSPDCFHGSRDFFPCLLSGDLFPCFFPVFAVCAPCFYKLQ
jgi:hypothetical protein